MDIKLKTDEAEIKSVVNWITSIGANTRNLWDIMTPIIKKSAAEEFSNQNPNKWKPLTQRYLMWKQKMGYPSTIGIRTGFLKESTVDNPDVVYADKSMEYRVIDSEGYFKFFHNPRPLFQHTEVKLTKLYADAVNKWIANDIEGGK